MDPVAMARPVRSGDAVEQRLAEAVPHGVDHIAEDTARRSGGAQSSLGISAHSTM